MYDDDRNGNNSMHNMVEQERMQNGQAQVSAYLAKVMGWMCVGLFTTLASSLFCIAVPQVSGYLFSSYYAIYVVMILQLVVVMAMSRMAASVSPATAVVMFMVYSALMGVTFTSLFVVFQLSSLLYVFGITAAVFLTLALYGFVTHKDLTRVGSLAMAGLVGIIIASLVNMFLRSAAMDYLLSFIAIGVFLALIAYDTQRIKALYFHALESGHDEDSPDVQKMAIFGALTLYLDFINLFLRLLSLFGKRRR